MKLGLDRVEALLAGMGEPQRGLRTLVVGGTNGKGSVASLTASILQAGGHHVGLFTSPHLCAYEERIRLNGKPIEAAEVEAFLEQFGPLIESCEATFFEATAALAFEVFRRNAVDVAVLEVGLGGRLDATNVTSPAGAVVTTIDLEHTGILGTELLQIAAEKYPIARPGRPLILGSVAAEVGEWFRARAADDGVPLTLLDSSWERRILAQDEQGLLLDLCGPRQELKELRLGLHGRHQADNCALACALLDRAGLWPDEDALRRGCAGVNLRGRFDVVRPGPRPVVIDVAHNLAGIEACVDTWREIWGERPLALVFSTLRDKDVEAMAERLAPLAVQAFIPPLSTHRARPPEAVAAVVEAAGIPARICAGVEDAFEEAVAWMDRGAAEGVLCTGSFFVAGDALRAWGQR